MPDDLLERLREALRTGPSLRFAFLFGSTARGTAREDSDVDVGIVPIDPSISLREELEIADRLERAARRPVDLVRLDTATNTLRWRVARDGVILVSDPSHEAIRWRARVGIEHDMDRELDDEAQRRYREALARGVPAR